MSINVVPNPLTTEPQSLGKVDAAWTAVHAEQGHLSYLRLHAFSEDITGHSAGVQALQTLYSSQLDDNSMSVFSSILHMRLDGLYVGNARVVLSTEIDVVNGKLDAFFGDISSQHLGAQAYYTHLEDGWDSLVQIVARIKGLAVLSTDIASLAERVTALEENGVPSSGTGGATFLGELSDVETTSTTLLDGSALFLKYVTDKWVNSAITYADITGTPDLTGYAQASSLDDYLQISVAETTYVKNETYNTTVTTVTDHGTRIAALETAPGVTPLTTTGAARNINVADGNGGLLSTSWLISAGSELAMAGSIVPTANAQYDLGAPEYKIRHLYLSDSSITMSPSEGAMTGLTATHVSFDAYAGALVSKTEKTLTTGELLSYDTTLDATAVIADLRLSGEYILQDEATGKTIRIAGDYAYWTTASGESLSDHPGQNLTYTTEYTLNRANVVLQGSDNVTVTRDGTTYTLDVNTDAIATKAYVDSKVGALVDNNTEYTFEGPLVLDTATNNVTFDGSGYTYTGDDDYISVSATNVISLDTNGLLLAGALDGYQQTLSVSDPTNLSITNNVLSLNALRSYKPGINGNLPLDGVDITVSQVRGGAATSKDGALLPTYYQLDNIRVSAITEYGRVGDTVEANYTALTLGGSLAQQRAITMPNTSMYFTPVLGDQFTPLKSVVSYAGSVFTTFHDEMVAAGWSTAAASVMFNSTGDRVNIGDTAYSDGDRAVHPALHVVQPGGEVVSLEVPADGIITERLRVRAYSGSPTSPTPMRGNVFLYTIDQNRSGLDTRTRKVYAIGPVLRYQDQTASKITTKITPLYSDQEVVDPATFSLDPTNYAAGLEHLQYVQTAVDAAMAAAQGKVEIGYYTVWESSVFSPDSGAIPHGARLRFHRDATVITEAQGVLGHVSYQNVWLPEPVSHDYARLPANASFSSLYVNHLEVTSNNSALFSNGVHILNTDVTALTGDSGYDHNTMDSGLLVATSGGVVGASSAKRFDSFAALYYDVSADEWRITRSDSGGASVTGSEATYVKTDGTTVFINDASGRPASDLRGTRIDANGNSSERILTESDIADMVTATTLSHYATAASLTNLATTVSNLSLTTELSSLTDVNVVAANLTSGQYLKWDASSDKWVAGSASDFTTGVTTVNGVSGAVTIDTDDVGEGATNKYYTDARVSTYLTASSYATEGYVDTAVSGLATTNYVDNAVANLVDTAPGTLDTLNELAAALGDDPNFATTMTNSLATKADKSQTVTAGTGIVTAGSLGSGVTVSLATATADTGVFGSSTQVPQLTIDSYGRVTAATLVAVNNFSGSYNDLSDAPNLATVATTGSYADLTDAPTLFDGAYTSLTGAPTLFSGVYADLTGKPTLFDGAYSSLSGAPTLFDGAYSSLSGAPNLATIATTGSYNDLKDAPSLFDGAYTSLTDAPALATVATTGSYNNLVDAPDLSVYATATTLTHYASTDDISGFITASSVSTNYALKAELTSGLAEKQDALSLAGDLEFTASGTLSTTFAIADYVTASSVSTNYALKSELTSELASLDLAGLVDINLDKDSLTDGQYLKWDDTTGAWVAGSATDFTTGVSSVAGGTGISVVGDGAVTVSVDTTVIATAATLSHYATAASLQALQTTVDGKQDAFIVGSGLALSGAGTLSATVDLSTYATQAYVTTAVSNLVDSAPGTLDTLNELAAALGDDANFATTVTNSIATKADATATANSLNALSTRVGDVEAFTITIADNPINIDGGVIAAATLTASLSSSMSTALGIDSLATADSLNALKAVVDGRVGISAVGDGLTLSEAGVLSASVDLSALATAATLSNYVLTTTAATESASTAASITALSGRVGAIEDDYLTSASTLSGPRIAGNIAGQAGSVDSLEGHSITLAGTAVSLEGGSITAASLSQALSAEMSVDLGISSLATSASVTDVSNRVASIEGDYVTSATTLSSAKLDNSSITVAGVSIDLGGAITAQTLSNALSLSDYATAATLSHYATASSLSALDSIVDARLHVTALDGDLTLTGGTLSTSFSIADYTTTTTLTAQLAAKQNTLTAGSDISISGTTIAVASTLSNAVAANSAKTGITAAQASAIVTNSAKIGYTDALARNALSATGAITYDSTTGVISYTSEWATDNGKITTENVVLVPGHLIEVFDMGTITSSADYSMDAGLLSGAIDRVVECGILDQERLF